MSLHKSYFYIRSKTAGGFEVRHNPPPSDALRERDAKLVERVANLWFKSDKFSFEALADKIRKGKF